MIEYTIKLSLFGCNCASTVHTTEHPHSLANTAVCISKFAFAMLQVIFPEALINFAIIESLHSLTVLQSLYEMPLIHASILILQHTIPGS